VELPVEIGQIVEADLEGDLGHPLFRFQQETAGQAEAQGKDIVQIRHPNQSVKEAAEGLPGQPGLGRDGVQGQCVGQVVADVVHSAVEPFGVPVGDLRRVAETGHGQPLRGAGQGSEHFDHPQEPGRAAGRPHPVQQGQGVDGRVMVETQAAAALGQQSGRRLHLPQLPWRLKEYRSLRAKQ
jgi:hypothetical protein